MNNKKKYIYAIYLIKFYTNISHLLNIYVQINEMGHKSFDLWRKQLIGQGRELLF